MPGDEHDAGTGKLGRFRQPLVEQRLCLAGPGFIAVKDDPLAARRVHKFVPLLAWTPARDNDDFLLLDIQRQGQHAPLRSCFTIRYRGSDNCATENVQYVILQTKAFYSTPPPSMRVTLTPIFSPST